MTNSITSAAYSAYNSLPSVSNLSLPSINLKKAAKTISAIALPVIAMVAISNIPTANAWFANDPEAFVNCMNACDNVESDLKLFCQALCWIVT